ncbi:MAG: DUF4097 family beta strand repeat-containing protein [Chthoniobacterales bacterium]
MKILLSATLALLFALGATRVFGLSEETINRELDATAGENLVVDVAFGTIEVAAGADNKVTIEAHRKIETTDEAREKQYLAEVPIVITKEGSTVKLCARRLEEKSWDWTCNTMMDAQYILRVPKKFNLDLKTGGGMVAASGITGTTLAATGGGKLKLDHLNGPLTAKTSGGNITLKNCDGSLDVRTSGGGITATEGSGELEARTSGGSISVRNFNGNAVVRTSGGKLIFEKINGRVSGKTSGGSIFASLLAPLPGEVELTSSAGSIELAVPSNAACNVEAKANMGSVSNELPIVASRAERDELRGAINGGGKSVILRSSAGSISIRSTSAQTAMQ